MALNSKPKQKSQLLLSKQRPSQSSNSPSPISDILWQGEFLDGVLVITSTPDPAVIEFQIDSIDCSCGGTTTIDLQYLNVSNASECIQRLIDSISTFYLGMLVRDREEANETLQ